MEKFTYGSVCSGVEAATVAWDPLGWSPAWLCEFDAFPSAVLKHHFPNVPNLDDMTKIEERPEYNDRTINLLVGGTPCQSFSIAGLRKGLDDERGNLAFKYCQILKEKRPRWFVWENVPGVLSNNGGQDFAAILSGFRECGYGFAYRIFNAKHFGVPQGRRRLFVVGHIADWRPAAAVLFERDSLRGNIKTGDQTRQGFTPAPTDCARKRYKPIVLDRAAYNQGENAQFDPMIEETETAPALVARGPCAVLTYRMQAFGEYVEDETASTIKNRDHKDSTDLIVEWDKVRRLTPIECERLQGFPDEWTNIPWKGKLTSPDSLRYKAMGNSMAVPVMRWIGERIKTMDELLNN